MNEKSFLCVYCSRELNENFEVLVTSCLPFPSSVVAKLFYVADEDWIIRSKLP